MQAFSKLRVIDLTHVLAGPFCTYQLAVLGADVIKVEAPGNPDMSRQSNSSVGLIDDAPDEHQHKHNHKYEHIYEHAPGIGSDFNAQNANKRSVCIDLKTADGVEIMRRLLLGADVLVENYRSGALAALGLGYQQVAALTPSIIYCSITGFGQRGPNAERTAYDNVIQAYCGLMAASGERAEAPLKVGPPVLDYGTGIQAAFAIAAALYQRAATGQGQYIDVAMLDSALMLMSSHVAFVEQHGKLPPLTGNGSACAGYHCYRTQHGLLMLGAYTAAQGRDMWAVLGDSAYGTSLCRLGAADMAARFAGDRRRIAARLLQKPAAQWEIEFNRHHVPAAKVRRLDQTLADPQLRSRGVLQPMPGASADTSAGAWAAGDSVGDSENESADASSPPSAAPATSREQSTPRLPTAAFQYATGGPRLTRPPPALAAHTHEVLREIGYADDELTRLQSRGVINMSTTQPENAHRIR